MMFVSRKGKKVIIQDVEFTVADENGAEIGKVKFQCDGTNGCVISENVSQKMEEEDIKDLCKRVISPIQEFIKSYNDEKQL